MENKYTSQWCSSTGSGSSVTNGGPACAEKEQSKRISPAMIANRCEPMEFLHMLTFYRNAISSYDNIPCRAAPRLKTNAAYRVFGQNVAIWLRVLGCLLYTS